MTIVERIRRQREAREAHRPRAAADTDARVAPELLAALAETVAQAVTEAFEGFGRGLIESVEREFDRLAPTVAEPGAAEMITDFLPAADVLRALDLALPEPDGLPERE